jgi:hypothetical protein
MATTNKRSASDSDSDIEPAAKRMAVDLLKCVICLTSLEYPALKCTRCRNCFCEADHARWSSEKDEPFSCPACRTTIPPKPAKLQNRILGQLPVDCPVKGCLERPTREDLNAHVAKCQLKHVPVFCSKCRESMTAYEEGSHVCAPASDEERERNRLLDEIRKLKRERDGILERAHERVKEEDAKLEERKKTTEKYEAQVKEAMKQFEELTAQEQTKRELRLQKDRADLERRMDVLERSLSTKLQAEFRGKSECLKISRTTTEFKIRSKLFTSNPRSAGLVCDVYATLHFSYTPELLLVELSVAKMPGTDLRFPIYVGGASQMLNLRADSCRSIASRLASESERVEIQRIEKPEFEQDEEIYVLWLLLVARVF